MTAANTAPTGWLLCNGSAVSRTTYADLFTAIGTTYGVGDGSTTFNIPDLRGRVPVGADSSQTEFDALGETGGAKTVTLTEAQIPSHLHSVDPPSANFTSGNESANHTHSFSFTETTNSEGDGAGRYDSSGNTSQGTQTYTTGGISANHTHTTTVNIAAFNSASTGGGLAHNNLQPYLVLNYIIKH
jgi:microcystin-dependent protein